MADALFSAIERMQAGRPWGDVLDAGTGEHSFRWLSGLPTRSITAITGDVARERAMNETFKGELRPRDRILTGNWTDPMLLQGERFEVVLADYLLGAIDGFAPYFQDRLFSRLRPHVGGRLYVVGLEPFPDEAETEGGRLILEIARLRDACILMAGHRTYREYPMDWVLRHLEMAGFVVEDALKVPILYRERYVNGQLDVCLRKLPWIRDRQLATELRRHVEELRQRTLGLEETRRGIRLGEDYVVLARPEDPVSNRPE